MVDVFDRHGVRFDPSLAGCNRFVRHADYAELEAEVERLTKERNYWQARAIDAERALAERAGGVKVLPDEPTEAILDAIVQDTRACLSYEDARGIYDAILSALTTEPAAPEGRKEAVAWPEPKVTNPDIANPTGVPYLDCLIHRLLDAQQDINLAANERMDQSLCDASSLIDEVETCIRRLAATRPTEQAVTDAMVEAAAIAISGGRKDLWDGFDLFKRASFRTRALHALKAAMEAGRHD